MTSLAWRKVSVLSKHVVEMMNPFVTNVCIGPIRVRLFAAVAVAIAVPRIARLK